MAVRVRGVISPSGSSSVPSISIASNLMLSGNCFRRLFLNALSTFIHWCLFFLDASSFLVNPCLARLYYTLYCPETQRYCRQFVSGSGFSKDVERKEE